MNKITPNDSYTGGSPVAVTAIFALIFYVLIHVTLSIIFGSGCAGTETCFRQDSIFSWFGIMILALPLLYTGHQALFGIFYRVTVDSREVIESFGFWEVRRTQIVDIESVKIETPRLLQVLYFVGTTNRTFDRFVYLSTKDGNKMFPIIISRKLLDNILMQVKKQKKSVEHHVSTVADSNEKEIQYEIDSYRKPIIWNKASIVDKMMPIIWYISISILILAVIAGGGVLLFMSMK